MSSLVDGELVWRGKLTGFLGGRLKRRFMLMGLINALFAPFIVLYLLMYSFFRYFEVSSSRFLLLYTKC